MMPFSAILTTVLLLLVSAVHLLWVLGSTWPAKDEQKLAKMVVGSKDVHAMPPRLASLIVAMVMLGAAHVVLVSADMMPGVLLARMYEIILVAMILIFSARGLAAYTHWWRAMVPEQPFATYDQKYYGPLCIVIATLLLDVALS